MKKIMGGGEYAIFPACIKRNFIKKLIICYKHRKNSIETWILSLIVRTNIEPNWFEPKIIGIKAYRRFVHFTRILSLTHKVTQWLLTYYWRGFYFVDLLSLEDIGKIWENEQCLANVETITFNQLLTKSISIIFNLWLSISRFTKKYTHW